MMGSESYRKVIIDCDVGTDDAQAIMMALAQPNIEVVAITAVFGNGILRHSSVNALRILKLCQRMEIPVFKGCESSLMGVPCVSDGFHGNDALGDIPDYPVDAELLQKEHAVSAIGRLLNTHPCEITIVALGPLTNLAVAYHMDPKIDDKIKELIIMGGNTTGKGNITPTAEFNFYSDPESASVVIRCMKAPILWIPVELCDENTFSWEWYAEFTKLDHKKVKFIEKAERKMIQNAKREGLENYPTWDQLAMATFINRDVVMETQDVYINIELHGHLTRGQTVVDWQGTLKQPPNVTLVTKVNTDLYGQLVIEGHTK